MGLETDIDRNQVIRIGIGPVQMPAVRDIQRQCQMKPLAGADGRMRCVQISRHRAEWFARIGIFDIKRLNLLGLALVQINRGGQNGGFQTAGILPHQRSERLEGFLGRLKVFLIAGDAVQFEQDAYRNPVGGRSIAAAGQMFRPHQQILVRCAGIEESAIRVGEIRKHDIRQFSGLLEPAFVTARLIQLQKPLAQIGIIVEVTRLRGFFGSIASQQPPIVVGKVIQDEIGCPGRHLGIGGLLEVLAGIGQRTDHQPVPTCQNLIIFMRKRPRVAFVQQNTSQFGHLLNEFLRRFVLVGGDVGKRPGQMRNIGARSAAGGFLAEIAFGQNLIDRGEQGGIGSERRFDLVISPQVKFALFAEHNGTDSAAQIKAFADTWRWDRVAAETYCEVVENSPQRVSQAMQAFRTFLGESDMLAYLSMMAPRLVELHRVLKETGALYLHCDPTANHYLKMLLDAVFSPVNFKNEIIWKRTSAHSGVQRCGSVHDVLLFYSKTKDFNWNPVYQPYDPLYIETFFEHVDEDGRRWKRMDLTGAGVTKDGNSGKPWRGIDVTAKGRHWAYNANELERLDKAGKIHWPKKKGGMPRLKQYLDEMPGVPLQDVWTDIRPIHNLAAERLGYPTQKPEALLERIIQASTNEGDTVLDPFCGCGTTIAVAQKLKRRWIGIDVTHLAVALMKYRLKDMFGSEVQYEVIGEPTDKFGAEQLAKDDPYQFQWWALSLVGARPVEQKKGADKGIDGRLYFHDEADHKPTKTKQIILSVKSGKVNVSHIRDLRGVIEREQAQIGVLITLNRPTRDMVKEAASAGFYKSAWGNHPALQILTIEELFDGRAIDSPPMAQVNVTFKKAARVKRKKLETPEFGFSE